MSLHALFVAIASSLVVLEDTMLPTWTAPLPDPNKPLGGYTQVLRLHTPHTKRTGNACAMKVNMQPNPHLLLLLFLLLLFLLL